MLMAGKNITQPGNLVKITVEQLFHKIRDPKPQTKALLERLRTLSVVDPEQYRKVKKNLPYVVPSVFNPPVRRRENFGYSEHLILDFDHLSEQSLDAGKVKDLLAKDARVELIFVSPGGDGLKVFFRLAERIYDYAKYSAFYKIFAADFAASYNLVASYDARTSDVTRACFVSFDPFAYYNASCERIDAGSFVDFDDIFSLQRKEKEIIKSSGVLVKDSPKTTVERDVFVEIKKKLNPDYKPRKQREKIIHVPQELENAEELVRKKCNELSITLENVRSINYGKQFLFAYEGYKAEINLFFGKKGYTIVKTTKSLNNKEFQEVVYRMMCEIFF